MTGPGIEPRSCGPLANTLFIWHLYIYIYIYIYIEREREWEREEKNEGTVKSYQNDNIKKGINCLKVFFSSAKLNKDIFNCIFLHFCTSRHRHNIRHVKFGTKFTEPIAGKSAPQKQPKRKPNFSWAAQSTKHRKLPSILPVFRFHLYPKTDISVSRSPIRQLQSGQRRFRELYDKRRLR